MWNLSFPPSVGCQGQGRHLNMVYQYSIVDLTESRKLKFQTLIIFWIHLHTKNTDTEINSIQYCTYTVNTEWFRAHGASSVAVSLPAKEFIEWCSMLASGRNLSEKAKSIDVFNSILTCQTTFNYRSTTRYHSHHISASPLTLIFIQWAYQYTQPPTHPHTHMEKR